MTDGFQPENWHEFFIATSGAGAALAGLVFVALSINLREILKGPGLVPRAAEALVLLVEIVVIGLVGLTPGVDAAVTGVLIAAAAIVVLVVVTRTRILNWHVPGPTPGQRMWTLVVAEAAAIPPVLAGVTLILGTGGGLYWLVPGVVFALAASMVDAWVLLIEILR